MMKFYISVYFITFSTYFFVSAQSTINTQVTGSLITEISTLSTVISTAKPNISCEMHNKDCKACVEKSQCYYCDTTDECHFHIDRGIVDGQCDLTHAYFLTCKTNFKTLVIIIGSLSAVPVLAILIVCCYCCCKKKGFKLSKDDIKWARQREERKQIAAEKRQERAARTEKLREKYGLVKESNPYQKFDDD